jgi:DNA-binding MarR family transcriptional regulator
VTLDAAIERIQFAYPQVYYACHTRHARKKSNPFHLSARDSEILVHLDRAAPTSLTSLARHMDLGAPTLSEAVSKLALHGYVTKTTQTGRDRRQIAIVLTPKGVAAVRATSVLEASRLKVVLQRLPKGQMVAAVGGLMKLAGACRK